MKKTLIAAAAVAGAIFVSGSAANAQGVYVGFGPFGYAPAYYGHYAYAPHRYVVPRRHVYAPRYHRRVVRYHRPAYVWPRYAYAPYHYAAPYPGFHVGYHRRGWHVGFGW